jgi:cell division protein DivIC
MKNFFIYLTSHKFLLIIFFILFYVLVNLLDGDRGYFSYVKKNNLLIEKTAEEEKIYSHFSSLKLKNEMLSSNSINLDYLDHLYRKFFILGKSGEKLYLIK